MWTRRQLANWDSSAWVTAKAAQTLRWLSTALILEAALLVVIDRQGGWGWLPRGILSAIAFCLCVLIAEWVELLPGRQAVFRWALQGTALLAGVVVIVDLPFALEAGERDEELFPWALAPWLRVPVAVVVGLVLVKLHLLGRFGDVAWGRRASVDQDVERLFPHQRSVLTRLLETIARESINDPGRVVQFAGRWGDGKSFLLHHLWAVAAAERARGREVEAASFVLVDVWKHEAEPDLHFAVLREVLGDFRYLARFGWLRYPALLALGAAPSGLVKLSLRLRDANAELPVVALPRLPWQRTFERLVRRQVRQGRRTVIILDEVDRATPHMAQAALTITRRALDVTGVTVVVSYVEEFIRFKAFTPSLVDDVTRIPLPDLGSTMEAVIFDHAVDTPGSGRPITSLATPGYHGPDSLAARLRNHYDGLDFHDRRRLQAKFAEKFLGRRVVKCDPFPAEGVARVPAEFKSLAGVAAKVVPGLASHTPAYVAAATAVLQGAVSAAGPWRPIRELEGRFFQILNEYERQGRTVRTPQHYAALVLAAAR